MVDVSALRSTAHYILKEEGVDELTGKLRELSVTNQQAAASTEVLGRQQRLAETNIQRVAAKLEAYTKIHDPLYRAQQQAERGERLLASARARGVEVTESQIAAVGKARQRYEEMSRAANDNAGAIGHTEQAVSGFVEQVDRIERFAWNNTGFSGNEIERVTMPIRTLGVTIGAVPTIALASFAAIAFAFHLVSQAVVDDLLRIDKAARDTGVSSDYFQVWTRRAHEMKVEVADLISALSAAKAATAETLEKGFTKIGSGGQTLIDLQAAGKISQGDVASFFGAGTQDDKLNSVLRIMSELLATGKEVEALRLGEAFFGAPEIVQRIAEGLKAGKMDMAALVDEAKAAGTIFDRELVERADDLDHRLQAAYSELADGLKPMMRELGALGLDIRGGWVSIVELMGEAVRKASAIYESLRPSLDVIRRVFQDAAAINQMMSPHAPGEAASSVFARMRGFEVQGPVYRPDLSKSSNEDVQGAVDANRRATAAFLKTLEPEEKDGKSAAASKSPAEKLDEVERYIRSLERQNASLEGEAAAIGKSNVEREQSIALARAEEAAKERGAALTQEETQRILRSAEAHATLREKVDEATKAKQRMEQAQNAFASGAESAIEKLVVDHQKLADVLGDVVNVLQRAALKYALLGGDDKSGVLGSIVSAIGSAISGAPKNAGGTDDWRGGWTWVGEQGPELLNVPRGSQIVPNAASIDYVNNVGKMVGSGKGLAAPSVLVQPPRVDLSGLGAIGRGGAPTTTVNIRNAPAGARAEESTDAEGNRQINIDMMAGELLARGLKTAQGRAAIKGFGLLPQTKRR